MFEKYCRAHNALSSILVTSAPTSDSVDEVTLHVRACLTDVVLVNQESGCKC